MVTVIYNVVVVVVVVIVIIQHFLTIIGEQRLMGNG